MFSEPSEKETSKLAKSSHFDKTTRNKRKRKLARKNKAKKQRGIKKISLQNIELSMSSWAENFTMAATWQLKHQVAHWKSRVKALEYENKVLRDTLKQFYISGGNSSEQSELSCTETQEESPESNESNHSSSDGDNDYSVTDYDEGEDETDCREVVPESNTIKAYLEPKEEWADNVKYLKRCYGNNWQRIAALECNVDCQFLSECDKLKPELWPNVPLNFKLT